MQQIALDIGIARLPSLDDYLAGPNEAALAKLRECLSSKNTFVPLYLWGPAACGKSHLLRAATEQLTLRGLTVGWMDSNSAPCEFDENWGAIVMDEVQSYDAAQQQQAFSWMVQAQSAQILVLAAGQLPPIDLQVREDLRNRLGWGHVFALEVLSEDQRRAVLRHEADARGFFLSDDVLNFMLTHFERDLSSLMQLLEQIDGYALYAKRAVTVPLIKSMLINA